MGMALNTLVNGSPDTLWLAADFLDSAASGADRAAFHAHHAGSVADGGWEGPARDAFALSTQNFHPDMVAMSDVATHYGRQIRDLGHALVAVNNKMNDALDKAATGSLRVEGPFIVAPDPPATPQVLPTGPCGTAEAADAMERNRSAQQQYNAAATDYNAKAAVFNECKALVTDARRIEKNAHDALEQAVGTPAEPREPLLNVTTAAATARGVLGGVEDTRRTYLTAAKELAEKSAEFTSFAKGQLGKLGPGFQTSLAWAASLNKNAEAYNQKAKQYGILRNQYTKGAIDFLTNYPTRPREGQPAKAGKTATKVFKTLPYVGAGITVYNEALQAATGKQSWGKAIVDTGATSAGAGLGGFLMGSFYGFVMGVPTGPGAIVTGLLGGFIGGIGGQKVADAVVPE